MSKTTFPLQTLWAGAVILASVSGLFAEGPQPPIPEHANNLSLAAGTVLRVNDDAITSAQVLAPIREKIQSLPAGLAPAEFARAAESFVVKSAMGRLYELLLYQKANQDLKQYEALDTAIESTIAEQRKKILAEHGGSEAQTRAELQKEGTTLEETLEQARREFIVQSYREIYFTPTLRITRQHMLKFYRDQLTALFTEPKSIEFRLIEIQFEKFLPSRKTLATASEQELQQAKAKAQQLADEAWRKIQEQTDFADVAQEFSHGFRSKQGGLWKACDPDSFRPKYKPITDALKTLAPGQTTGIVTGPEGLFIGLLIEYKKGGQIPFCEVQEEIKDKLRQQRWLEHSNRLGESLLKDATVGNVQEFVQQSMVLAYENLYQNADAALRPESP